MSVYKKPRWAPNAIATEKGWVDPDTGELLVSLKNLKSKIEGDSKKEEPKKANEKTTQKAKDKIPPEPVMPENETAKEGEVEKKPEEKPKRKRRGGRPRKTK